VLGEDEDDNDEDDLNLVNPKFTKNSSTMSTASSTTGKKKSKLTNEPGKENNEVRSKKMKQWKVDFYRDQDRDMMDVLSRKLRKMRKKQKSASSVLKSTSSVKRQVTKSINSSKMSTRKNSKKIPVRSSNRRIIK
jgi:hypothetical protein